MRLFCAAIVLATALPGQDPNSASSYTGQSRVGLLVSADCNTSRAAKHSTPDGEANLTSANRVTTPAVDANGTRGQQETSTTTQHNAAPKTGDIRENGARADPGWKAAQKQARSLPQSCTVDGSTTRFSLLLPDGRVLAFDDLAGQEIAKHLRAAGRRSVYRVQVADKLQQGAIALDTIQM